MTRSIGFPGGVRLAALLLLAALCSCARSSPAGAADRSPAAGASLVVRLYGSGLASRDLREAVRVATRTLAGSGIHVEWKDCRKSTAASELPVCRQSLAGNESVLRLMPAATAMDREATALGFTLLDLGGRRAVLSTVYMDRVDAVATRTKIEPALLTGRAMAHEIGHLLLGTSGHAPTGLMRAFWSDDLLRYGSDADWRLLPAEVDAIIAGQRAAVGNAIDVTGGS
jgi:hypothetical protein